MVEGKYVRGPRVRQAADGAGSRVVACRSELSGGGGSRVARAPWGGDVKTPEGRGPVH